MKYALSPGLFPFPFERATIDEMSAHSSPCAWIIVANEKNLD